MSSRQEMEYFGDGLADVIELIRVNDLPADYREKLHPYVRSRFAELWEAAQATELE